MGVFVDQAAQDGFSEDPSAVEVGNYEAATVVFTVGEHQLQTTADCLVGHTDCAALAALTMLVAFDGDDERTEAFDQLETWVAGYRRHWEARLDRFGAALERNWAAAKTAPRAKSR